MALTLVEKMFALKDLPLFGGLHESELTTIAEAGQERRFRPDEELCRKGQVLEKVYVVIGGDAVTGDGGKTAGIIGTGSLLYRLPVRFRLTAAPETGCVCLVFRKAHFFTIIHQCPALLCNLMETDLPEGRM